MVVVSSRRAIVKSLVGAVLGSKLGAISSTVIHGVALGVHVAFATK